MEPVNDLPTVSSTAHALLEDSAPNGKEIVLNLTDAEIGQVLFGYVTKLPTKGALFVVNASGHRIRVDGSYNPFDVGTPNVRQYLSRVVKVSSYWGGGGSGNAPYAGYHALGILGPPDCKDSTTSNECAAGGAWVGNDDLFPPVGQHVLVASGTHVAYVRAVHEANHTLDVEAIQYYRYYEESLAQWEPCYLDIFAQERYPEHCRTESEGGGLNHAFGRPKLHNLPRSAITPFNVVRFNFNPSHPSTPQS